jgi:hypothetical protein
MPSAVSCQIARASWLPSAKRLAGACQLTMVQECQSVLCAGSINEGVQPLKILLRTWLNGFGDGFPMIQNATSLPDAE